MKFERKREAVISWDCSVNEVFAEMSEGERMHMVNKLNKEGYVGAKQLTKDATDLREWDILENACDFWKETAEDLGYGAEAPQKIEIGSKVLTGGDFSFDPAKGIVVGGTGDGELFHVQVEASDSEHLWSYFPKELTLVSA
jgi:hypothetical protein